MQVVAPSLAGREGHNAQCVGTAYDFWIRAFIQRINRVHLEIELSDIVKRGINELRYWEDAEELTKHANEAWELRNQYILGENVSEYDLMSTCLFLTGMENAYRSSNPEEHFPSTEANIEDLLQITAQTKKVAHLFIAKNKEEIVLNPQFGMMAEKMNGADADLIIDGALIDVKTTKDVGFLSKHMHQIIGYYLLAQEPTLIGREEGRPVFGPSLPKITKVGWFFSRYNHLVLMDIEDLLKKMDFESFSKQFHTILGAAPSQFFNLEEIERDEDFISKLQILNTDNSKGTTWPLTVDFLFDGVPFQMSAFINQEQQVMTPPHNIKHLRIVKNEGEDGVKIKQNGKSTFIPLPEDKHDGNCPLCKQKKKKLGNSSASCEVLSEQKYIMQVLKATSTDF